MDEPIYDEPIYDEPIFTTPEVPSIEAEMDEVDRSILGTVKNIFVITKTTLTIIATLQAAYAWNNSKKPMGKPV